MAAVHGVQNAASSPHISVMLAEVMELLQPVPGGRYLDGTLGLGGHAEALLRSVDGQADLLGLDRDTQALAHARTRLEPFGQRVHTRHDAYSHFEEHLDDLGWDVVHGALLDLGVSSLQLDSPERGFSFLADGPLDMRMDGAGGAAPARSLVNKASVERLKEIIAELGEEPMAGRIARAIVSAREDEPIETTAQLAAIVTQAYPAKWRRTARNHPATRTFQALRMAVNAELDELSEFLSRIPERLAPGGRVVIISFHSLEDRLVKLAFREEAKGCRCPARQPVCTCGGQPRLRILTKKPLVPTEAEQSANPRSRSAKLRAAERLDAVAGELIQ